MINRNKKNIKEAISLGKKWMEDSVNSGHDYEHASDLLKHAKMITKEIPVADFDLLELAIWWHDAYKSRLKLERVKDAFVEGKESRKIFIREVGKLLPNDVLEIVGNAIEMHSNPWSLILYRRNLNPVTQVLVEADQIDVMNDRRKYLFKNPFTGILSFLLGKLSKVFLAFFAKSQYTKGFLVSVE